MINTTTLTLEYTGPRATPWTTVLDRLIGELSGYNFGTPRIVARSDESITVTVDAVKRGDSQ